MFQHKSITLQITVCFQVGAYIFVGSFAIGPNGDLVTEKNCSLVAFEDAPKFPSERLGILTL
jgi:hypothetical protein